MDLKTKPPYLWLSPSMWMWFFVKISIYHIIITLLLKKIDKNSQILHMAYKHNSNYVEWHDSIEP
jgi:hypothetical protein